MKKIVSVIIAAMTAILVLAFAGCSDPDTKAFKELNDKYGKIAEATTIVQEIRIASGDLTKYVGVKTLKKTNSGYDVTEEEKTRGELGQETDSDGFIVKSDSYSVAKSSAATVGIGLNKSNFATYEFTGEGGLTATVGADKIKDVLSLDNVSSIKDLKLTIKVGGDRIDSIEATYNASGDAVTITIKMTY